MNQPLRVSGRRRPDERQFLASSVLDKIGDFNHPTVLTAPACARQLFAHVSFGWTRGTPLAAEEQALDRLASDFTATAPATSSLAGRAPRLPGITTLARSPRRSFGAFNDNDQRIAVDAGACASSRDYTDGESYENG